MYEKQFAQCFRIVYFFVFHAPKVGGGVYATWREVDVAVRQGEGFAIEKKKKCLLFQKRTTKGNKR